MDIISFAQLVFSFQVTIHNSEGVIWLPEWSNNAESIIRPTDAHEFRFAASFLTVLVHMVYIVVGINEYMYFVQ